MGLKKSFLVVDDSATMRQLIVMTLKKMGCTSIKDAPNGRVLMFFRESEGANGGARIYSVDVTGYNERPIPTPSFGSDPAWSPLLS